MISARSFELCTGLLANGDPAMLDLNSTPTVILVQRYVLAVLYYATNGEAWVNTVRFLSAPLVCGWNNGQTGALCNEDSLVVARNLCKSTHEEVAVFI